MISVFLQPFRFVTVFLFILTYMALTGLIWLVPWGSRWSKLKVCTPLLSAYCRLGLKILNVHVHVEQLPPPSRSYLIVGNHLSYLDILIIAAQRPTCFVTSQEIRETPFLGQICQLAGCLFVERRNKQNLQKEIHEITEALEKGLNVVIFPEATSTNGEEILRFRRPLYSAAVFSKTPILPFCLNYRWIEGEVVGPENRDLVCWYGDMDFAPHLWKLAGLSQVKADLIFRPVMDVDENSDVTELAEVSRQRVLQAFRPLGASGASESLSSEFNPAF